MNRFALTAAIALGLTLTACQNEPEEDAAGSSGDSVAPTAPDTAGGDEVVSEGPTDDATPFAGTTGGGDSSSASGSSGGGASTASGSDAGTSTSGTMQSGASTEGQRPPKGSKVQRAD